MGQDPGSESMVRSSDPVLLLPVRVLRQHHYVRLLQQVRPQCAQGCSYCDQSGHGYLPAGWIHDIWNPRTFGSRDRHRWHWNCGKGWRGSGLHFLPGRHSQVQEPAADIFGAVLPYVVCPGNRLQHCHDILFSDCHPGSVSQLQTVAMLAANSCCQLYDRTFIYNTRKRFIYCCCCKKNTFQ